MVMVVAISQVAVVGCGGIHEEGASPTRRWHKEAERTEYISELVITSRGR
jgi:hypothetical protein